MVRAKYHGTTTTTTTTNNKHHLYAHVVAVAKGRKNPYAHARSLRENCHGISINSKIHADDLIIFYSISAISIRSLFAIPHTPHRPMVPSFNCCHFIVFIRYVTNYHHVWAKYKLIEFVRFYIRLAPHALTSHQIVSFSIVVCTLLSAPNLSLSIFIQKESLEFSRNT